MRRHWFLNSDALTAGIPRLDVTAGEAIE